MKSDIKINIELDAQRQPKKILWTADAKEGKQTRESKAMLLSFFDKDTLETFKIDLWTTDMQVAEMDRLMFHTLKALSDTYFNATKNENLANQMRSFVNHFGLSCKIIKEDNPSSNHIE